MMSASVSPSAIVWRSTITGDASGRRRSAGIGTNDVNGPDASSRDGPRLGADRLQRAIDLERRTTRRGRS